MKTIIAGSRNFNDYLLLKEIIKESNIEVSIVVSGMAKGADSLGEFYAYENKLPIEKHPADWNTHGKAAGPIRNQEMVDVSEAAIIVCTKDSRGSHDCYKRCLKKGLTVHLQYVIMKPNGKWIKET